MREQMTFVLDMAYISGMNQYTYIVFIFVQFVLAGVF